MVEYKAYACWWLPYNMYQGWVIGTFDIEGEEVQLIQTIRTDKDLDVLKDDLGIDRTDRPWQVNASRSGSWSLTWDGLVDVVHPYEGVFKTILDKPLLIDPYLGMPVDRYWGADQYREALPILVWKFDPWTGKYRKPEDMINDPQGLLIADNSTELTV